jgi:hypothetical protein
MTKQKKKEIIISAGVLRMTHSIAYFFLSSFGIILSMEEQHQ